MNIIFSLFESANQIDANYTTIHATQMLNNNAIVNLFSCTSGSKTGRMVLTFVRGKATYLAELKI